MSKKELVRLVEELEQCRVQWRNCLTPRSHEYVVLRVGVGVKPYSTNEISEKLCLSSSLLKKIELKAESKLRNLAHQEREKRRNFWFYLRFIESLSKLQLNSLEYIVAVFASLYSLSIYNLKLSSRTLNMLCRAGIFSIGDTINYEDLYEIKNIGAKSVEEITAAIQTFINAS